MYNAVTRGELQDVLVHVRDLYRRREPANQREALIYERREIGIRQLLSNLPRTKEHPTLRLVLEVADLLSLTLDGAHQLFGYDLGQLLSYDLRLNSARTHIESLHQGVCSGEVHRSLGMRRAACGHEGDRNQSWAHQVEGSGDGVAKGSCPAFCRTVPWLGDGLSNSRMVAMKHRHLQRPGRSRDMP